jgi:hypothetical protein
MGWQGAEGRGLWRSGVVTVATVSSKEFMGTLRTRFACGKLVEIFFYSGVFEPKRRSNDLKVIDTT